MGGSPNAAKIMPDEDHKAAWIISLEMFSFPLLTSMLRKCLSLSCTERWEWEWTWLGVHLVKKEKKWQFGVFSLSQEEAKQPF